MLLQCELEVRNSMRSLVGAIVNSWCCIRLYKLLWGAQQKLHKQDAGKVSEISPKAPPPCPRDPSLGDSHKHLGDSPNTREIALKARGIASNVHGLAPNAYLGNRL